MNRKKMSTGISRLLILTLILAMLSSMMAGCQSDENPDETDSYSPPGLLEGDETEPEDTSTEPEGTSTQPEESGDPTAPDAVIGTVITDTLNIRSTPSTESKAVGQLVKGDTVEILREEQIGEVRWGRIESGWVCLDYMSLNTDVEEDPTDPESTDPNASEGEDHPDSTEPKETEPEADPVMGVVTGSQLNVRSGPGTDNDAIGEKNYGDRVAILEQKGDWGRIEEGWISLNYVYQDGTTGKNTTSGFITGNALNVRSGPGTKYESVSSLNAGNKVNILEQITVGDMVWGCTKDGWISMSYVYEPGDDGKNPCTGTVTGDDLSVRSGPGTGYERISSLDKGAEVNIQERITVGNMTWGYNGRGWISMDYVDVAGEE